MTEQVQLAIITAIVAVTIAAIPIATTVVAAWLKAREAKAVAEYAKAAAAQAKIDAADAKLLAACAVAKVDVVLPVVAAVVRKVSGKDAE